MTTVDEQQYAYQVVQQSLNEASIRINDFCREVLKTRGGRIGSGMGSLLEALWGYEINFVLNKNHNSFCELAWFPDHQYHDFACVKTNKIWNPLTGQGEFFRVEAKSMNFGAAESKAHFDVLKRELNDFDALLLIVWKWIDIDEFHCSPQIIDTFFGEAIPITMLRDELHFQRGGSFVNGYSCPDRCVSSPCKHDGEPLNERGKRERLSGPEVTRPSAKVSYSANFGGLVRMLKTRGENAKNEFRRLRKLDKTIDKYISFIHRNFPSEELNHFSASEWREIGKKLSLPQNTDRKIIHQTLQQYDMYQNILKEL